jgi:hypothetical protein
MALPLNYETVRPPIPAALKTVAWVFIGFGILAAIQMFMALFDHKLTLKFGLLGIFVGPGLLRLRAGWRTCGLVLIWFDLICLPLMVLLGVIGISFATAYFYRNLNATSAVLNTTSLVFGIARVGLVWALAFWQYRVLTRPDIRALFLLPAAE